MRDPNDTAPCMGVFGLRITLGRPFPGSLPVVSPTSSPSPLRNSPGFTPGSCDLIRAAPYRLMEDIRDPHSMPHSPVNVPSHTTESAQTTTSWGEKLHGNREVLQCCLDLDRDRIRPESHTSGVNAGGSYNCGHPT